MRLARALRLSIAAQREQSPADPEYGASTRPILSKITPHQPLAHACERDDLAYFTSDSDVQQLYTGEALVLDASTRVAAAAGSGLIDLHLHCIYKHVQTGLGCRLHQP